MTEKVKCILCGEEYYGCEHTGEDIKAYSDKLEEEGIEHCLALTEIMKKQEELNQWAAEVKKERNRVLEEDNNILLERLHELKESLEKRKRKTDD